MTLKITADKLAEFITARTPGHRDSIVRQLRPQKRNFAPYYQAFKPAARDFLEGGAVDVAILAAAMAYVRTRKGTRWHEIDNGVTIEALKALKELAPQFQRSGFTFHRPQNGHKAVLAYPEIQVNVTPHMIVHGERKGAPLVGALRFYLAKGARYQIGQVGARLVAVMQHQWQLKHPTEGRIPDASLCMVAESMQRRITTAPADISADLATIEKGAQAVVARWHLLFGREAA